ncbi:MAG: cysteine desulfurase / selenocysteine lyase [Frankiaceae bacterium]|nr:cysteine desulfurase / selenocysteine lyase [Frankiaceae bacterium]
MSTSNGNGAHDGSSNAASNGHGPVGPLGAPSAEWLAQLANSMFRLPPSGVADAGTSPAVASAPTSDPHAAVTTTPVITAPAPPVPTGAPHSPVAPPGMPVSAEPLTDPTAAYYFLGSATSGSPLGAVAEGMPVPADAASTASSDPYAALTTAPATTAPKPPVPTVVPHSPAAPPGMPVSAEPFTDPTAAYYFLTGPADGSASGMPAAPAQPPGPAWLSPGVAGDPSVTAARADFPALHQQVHGKPLIWFDNAATTQKPRAVMDALTHFYEHDNSNVHRGAHTLAARATDAYEGARASVARLLGASSPEDIVFVRGTTEGINLVAQSLGRQTVGQDDEIVVTTLEHHANIVPWQMLAKEKGAKLRVVEVDDSGQVLLDHYASLLNPRTRIVALSHVSNALGTVLPVEQMIAMAHKLGVPVVVDGAQSVAHMPVDVNALDADFYVFSGHKIFGPTGIGAVYGRRDLLESMPPWQGGGSMIRDVTFDATVYNDPPYKFEAGTPSIADAVGLRAAVDYVMSLGMPRIFAHEQALTQTLMQTLGSIPGVRLIGTAADKVGVASFVIDGIPTERIGTMLDQQGIAVRSGHHCAQPALRRFGLESTVRPSLAFYNTDAEIETLGRAVRDITRSVH